MNKAQLVASIAGKTGLTKKDSESAINALVSAVMDSLAKGEKVTLVGFGTFEVRQRKDRKGRNPRTKAVITIPGRKSPGFSAGSELRAAVK